jgi:hypothetical protein
MDLDVNDEEQRKIEPDHHMLTPPLLSLSNLTYVG